MLFLRGSSAVFVIPQRAKAAAGAKHNKRLLCSKEASSGFFCIYLFVEIVVIKDLRIGMIGWMQK